MQQKITSQAFNESHVDCPAPRHRFSQLTYRGLFSESIAIQKSMLNKPADSLRAEQLLYLAHNLSRLHVLFGSYSLKTIGYEKLYLAAQ